MLGAVTADDASTEEPTGEVKRRRRGAELERALLSAAWDELAAVGYANLTMESVAARARTGIAVLYRRWANKDQLVFAALEHYRDDHPVTIPDTGTLPDDLVGLLTGMSTARATFFAIAGASAFSGLLADTGMTPGQVRDRFFGNRPPRLHHTIYERAHARGEIDLDRIPSALLAMPFDLVRHDLLLDFQPLSQTRIRAIVDDLFMPLVGLYSSW